MESSIVFPQLSAIQIVGFALFATVTVDAVRRFIRGRIDNKGNPLPPGPTPLPLLGSALSMNSQKPWLTYTTWGEKYGDVVYVRLPGTAVIVLNSRTAAIELLDKRSQIYSDRPNFAILESYGFGGSIGFARYGSYWRLGRRIIHQTFRAESSLAFRPMQLRRSRRMIADIIDDPTRYLFHYKTFSSAVGLSAIYDYEPKPRGDPLVKLLAEFTRVAAGALTSDKMVLLGLFPFLLRIPKWIPGLSQVRREANLAYDLSSQLMETPYQIVQKRMVSKEDVVSDTMVFHHNRCMEEMDGALRAEYEEALKRASTTALLGVTHTTSAIMMSFTLAMVKNPLIWKCAQAELDAVIGTNRLPEFDDRPSLPYVDAIVRESLRWIPALPMGIPHAVTSDDVYNGYHVPRGAIVYSNLWSMSRDKTRYPDAEAFVPERFLTPEGTLNDDNPADFVFGFGRRICPGRYAADASLWCGIATLLATLDFNCVKDAKGNDIEFEVELVTGFVHHPPPFLCNLVPRRHITKEVVQHLLAK